MVKCLTLLSYKDEKTYKKLTRELEIKAVQKIWYKGEMVEGNSKTVAKERVR